MAGALPPGTFAISLVQPISFFVLPARAETPTATSLPRSRSFSTRAATWRMRSKSATEVPPNFIAILAIYPAVAAFRVGAYIDGRRPRLNANSMTDTTIDAAEVAKFSAMAEEWWDPAGKFAPLHKFNPIRLKFIRDTAAAHFGRAGLRPFEGLALLDIGCG